jgi:hypothetical protein
MGKWPYKLKHCSRHVEHQHEEHMEYGGMIKGMVNPYGKKLKISTDVIYAQVEEGRKFSNVGSIVTLIINNSL